MITSAFAPKLIVVYITLIIYASIIIIMLWLLNVWGIYLLKDTIIWLLFSAVGTVFSLTKIKDVSYFVDLIKSNITITAAVQFIINLYSFSLVIELMTLPVLVFLTILSIYSKNYTENGNDYKKVHLCLNKLLGMIGFIYIGFSLYKTIINFNTNNWGNLSKQFMLPLILTISFIPYYWGLALYMNYEIMFIASNVIFRSKNKFTIFKIKSYALYYGHFSLKRINRIKHEMAFLAYQNEPNYRSYIKKTAQAPSYKKSSIINKMKIKLFNNIDSCCKALSDLRLGEFSEWKKLHGLDEFFCITDYFPIKHYEISNLVLSLQGEEFYIHQLELSLSILSANERDYAISKFQKCVLKIIRLLSLKLPYNIYNSIAKNSCNYRDKTFSLSIQNEIIGNMESFTLVIKSE